MTGRSRIRWAIPVLAVLVACGHSSPGPDGGPASPTGTRTTDGTVAGGAAGSCAMLLEFRGREYEGRSVEVAPEFGPRLGDGVFPPCNDTGGTSGSAQRVPLTELPGVSPDDAVLVDGWDDTVMVREGLDPLPPEVLRLITAPACASADAPLRLEGPWLGIVGADGKTELDLLPPYDVDLRVRSASSNRYARAHLTLRVPADLGRPITHDDIRDALWEPGTLTAQVHCSDDGRFIVDEISVAPEA